MGFDVDNSLSFCNKMMTEKRFVSFLILSEMFGDRSRTSAVDWLRAQNRTVARQPRIRMGMGEM